MLRQKVKSEAHQLGQSLVEFALVVLVLMTVFMGVFDLGYAAYAYNTISLAAREGARYGVICTHSNSGVRNWVISQAVGLSISASQIQVSSNPASPDSNHPACSGAAGLPPHFSNRKVTVTYTYAPLTTIIVQALGVNQMTLTAESTMVVE